MPKNVKTATEVLGANDPIMHSLISAWGPCSLAPHTRYYEELVSSIVSQQLSVKAAATIWKRFLALFDNKMPAPSEILDVDTESLRGVGLSYRKASYVHDLAQHILDGRLQIDRLPRLSNQEIIDELVAVRGIGEWSAHMFMIFSLGRLDVLAWGDLGIRKSAMQLYGFPNLASKEQLVKLAHNNGWTGYESVACWYLWKNLDNQ